jgi:Flp pilus assembly protein protease CpaA
MKTSNDLNIFIPFVRWKIPNAKNDFAITYAGDKFITEILFTAILIISAVNWHSLSSGVASLLIFVSWGLILTLVFALALSNMKNGLLPNRFVYPMGVLIVIFQLINSVAHSNAGIIGSAILGALILGGIPYVLFQVSAGKWIGGGDVKVGFYAGLLLGWKAALIAISIVALLVGAMYLVVKFTKYGGPQLYATGLLWAGIIIVGVLLEH